MLHRANLVLLMRKESIEPSESTIFLEYGHPIILSVHISHWLQSPKAHKLGADFELLASDVVYGTAFALLCTPKPEQSDTLSLLRYAKQIFGHSPTS